MMRTTVLLSLAAIASASLTIGDEARASPTQLAAEYATKLSQGAMGIPKDVMRAHIRRDLVPRLLDTEDNRALWGLGLNVFDKLNSRIGSLVQMQDQIKKGESVDGDLITDIVNKQKDLARDIHLMTTKIEENKGASEVSDNVIRLMANAAKGFSCAFKDTEVAMATQGEESSAAFLHKQHACKMPFPGSLVMLGQKITVPQHLDVILPAEGDSMRLKPQVWMAEHMRRKLWCPDSFKKVGFGVDMLCDAVSSALDMPHQADLQVERSSFAQLGSAIQDDAPLPAASAETPEMKKLEAQEKKATSFIQTQLEDNAKRFEELHAKELELGKKLSLAQKKQRLADLKERLAASQKELSKFA